MGLWSEPKSPGGPGQKPPVSPPQGALESLAVGHTASHYFPVFFDNPLARKVDLTSFPREWGDTHRASPRYRRAAAPMAVTGAAAAVVAANPGAPSVTVALMSLRHALSAADGDSANGETSRVGFVILEQDLLGRLRACVAPLTLFTLQPALWWRRRMLRLSLIKQKKNPDLAVAPFLQTFLWCIAGSVAVTGATSLAQSLWTAPRRFPTTSDVVREASRLLTDRDVDRWTTTTSRLAVMGGVAAMCFMSQGSFLLRCVAGAGTGISLSYPICATKFDLAVGLML